MSRRRASTTGRRRCASRSATSRRRSTRTRGITSSRCRCRCRLGRYPTTAVAAEPLTRVSTLYDRIGGSYQATRRPDPRIAGLILEALGDARSVLNVGAGTGSYEPTDREVLAVEPSATMIAQRPAGAAPVLQASAEELPLPDKSYDAALAVNTVHHWADVD